jgi:hypothetical protein
MEFWIGWLDLFTPYTHHSGLQQITCYRWSTHFANHLDMLSLLSLHSSYPDNGFQHSSYTSIPHEAFFAPPDSFLAIILPICQLRRRDSILILAAWDPRYIASGRPHRKHRFLYCCVLIHCFRDVLTAPLRSNERGADHRKHSFFIVARVRFRGNVFTVPLPSNKLFRLSDVMSEYLI